MKRILLLLFFTAALSLNLNAQEESNYLEYVQNVDTTIETLYKVISGEKGEERNWDLFTYLFHENAKLIPSRPNQNGNSEVSFMTPQQYINTSGKWLIENGFYEKEISKKVEVFGAVTHVFSTYESFKSKTDTEPFMRGINSIQLFNDGERYWILNVFWASETESTPIPKKYLKPY